MGIPGQSATPAVCSLSVRMFGHLAVTRNGEALALPPSRKVRALLAYLATSPHPVGRSRLCELLGDIPNDPRGELRWCLSKLRSLLEEPYRNRVQSREDLVWLDLAGTSIDVLRVDLAMRSGIETLKLELVRELCDLMVGDFLEGLDLARSPQLDHWLAGQRRHYRTCQASLLERLIELSPDDPELLRKHADRWVALSPLDIRAQTMLLKALLQSGPPDEAERHFLAINRLFSAEKIGVEPIRRAWLEMQRSDASPVTVPATVSEPHPRISIDGSATKIPVDEHRRASLAVLPLADCDRRGEMAAGLTHDIITRLAKLRSLFVIARGSVFALAEQGISPEDTARRLDVDYYVAGVVKRRQHKMLVSVELVETRTSHIVWSEEFELRQDDTFLLLDDIGDKIVASIAHEIETAEKNRAILKPPNSLNAWEAYHRGLWHMYRFTRPDNDLAQQFFTRSIETDPTFARAYAGLSFTHWQSAFQHWADRARETDLALKAAGRSLIVDEHDPAAHWAMGRAMWLRGRHGEAVAELERSVELSPNFALGHYALAFVQSQSGDPSVAIASSDHSRSLSPFDPLLFGMLGARAMAHVRLGQYEEAADWALMAAARPNAHIIILAIAAHCLALADRLDEARNLVAVIRQTIPNFRVADFLATFRFAPDTEEVFRRAAHCIGLD